MLRDAGKIATHVTWKICDFFTMTEDFEGDGKIFSFLEWSNNADSVFLCASMKDLLVPVLMIAVILVIVVAVMYNSLVNRRNQVKYAFSCIDVQLKKRFDLIPNLVETVKAFAAHEKDLLDSVTQARALAAQPGASWATQEMMQQQVQALVARAEDYPELRSNQNFLLLQRHLAECEEQISAARRAYNASVMDYQNSIGMFPSSIIASLFHFRDMPSFEIAVQERNNVHVRF